MVNTSPFSGLIKDNQAGSVGKNQDSGRIASIDAMRQEKTEPDAMRQKSHSNWHHGNCEHCKTDFKKNTVWQKFCCSDCRKAAYEVRTGKVWHGKKTAGQGS